MDIDVRSIERRFTRAVIRKGYFLTAKGLINKVETLEGDTLILSSSKQVGKIKITRTQIRKAIRYIKVLKTAIRQDMEAFSRFSTSLFAIMIEVFRKESVLQTLKNGLFQLSILGVRYFPSGLERDVSLRKVLKELGGNYVLFNYYQLLKSSSDWISILENEDFYCIIDSGSFSYFQNKKKEKLKSCRQEELLDEEFLNDQYIEAYANFINQYKHHPRVIGFFAFDCIGDQKLKSLTDAKIFPVWQITDSLEELERLVDEEPEMIGLGGAVPYLSNRLNYVRSIFRRVFNKYPTVNFHVLGIANELLLEYPCFSADGTAFINARKSDKQRKVYLDNGKRIPAPLEMTTLDIIKQNLKFLLNLESHKSARQLALTI